MGKNVGKRHFQADFEEKENPQPLAITEVGDLVWWMIRGSNTVDIFKQISEIVEKKGADIVYRVMSGQMYPEVYPRFSEINALQ